MDNSGAIKKNVIKYAGASLLSFLFGWKTSFEG
jgi:hypothetical protein